MVHASTKDISKERDSIDIDRKREGVIPNGILFTSHQHKINKIFF